MSVQAESLEILEKAEVPPAQARAIVRAIEIEIEGAKDTLATKHDLHELRSDLRQEMAELRGELKAEIHGSASSVTRQMYAALLGQMAVLLGFAYFFATHVR
jgi:FtsZ-binding cell division protein ZapB